MPAIKKESLAKKEIIIGGISSKDRILLVEQLHAGVKAGYSITDTLFLAQSQSRGRMKLVLEDVIQMVKTGAYLFESFGKYPKYFSPLFTNMIKTGELSSSLEDSLWELLDMLRKQIEFNQKLRSALTYPTFVLIAILGLGLSVSFFVLPSLLPLFQSLNTELPKSTQILMSFASLFDAHGRTIIWGTIAFIVIVFWLSRKSFAKPFTHWLALHFPIIGSLYRKIVLARLSRTMNSLLKSGVTIDQSIDLTSGLLGNIYYRNILKSILPLIAKGETLSDSLEGHDKLFENLFMRMLALGERTGSLEDSFSNIADYYERDVDNRTKNLMISLEPILLIFVGLIVGFVAISILGPIYSISGSIGR